MTFQMTMFYGCMTIQCIENPSLWEKKEDRFVEETTQTGPEDTEDLLKLKCVLHPANSLDKRGFEEPTPTQSCLGAEEHDKGGVSQR